MITTTFALGCYSRGPTWDTLNVQRGNKGFSVIAEDICDCGSGTGRYPAYYEVEGCLLGGKRPSQLGNQEQSQHVLGFGLWPLHRCCPNRDV
jgi:hypothetical protein